MVRIQEHIIRSMIPEWDTNSLLCFFVKNFVYQSLTDLTVMLFSEYVFFCTVSHIDHRDAPHSTFFHFKWPECILSSVSQSFIQVRSVIDMPLPYSEIN